MSRLFQFAKASCYLTHSELLAVLHELRQVQYGLCDLRNILQCEGLLEAGHQILLVNWTKLHPT